MSNKKLYFIVISGPRTGIGESLDEAANNFEEESGEPPSIDNCEWYKAEKIKVGIQEVVKESFIED